jgi:fused signal recognition particle receptor
MVFNWFRRQHDKITDSSTDRKDSEPQESQATTTPAEEKKTEPDGAESSASSEQTSGSDDLLQWAKAAYANIQKESVPATETSETTTESPASTEVESVEQVEPETTPPSEVEKVEAIEEAEQIESAAIAPEAESEPPVSPEATTVSIEAIAETDESGTAIETTEVAESAEAIENAEVTDETTVPPSPEIPTEELETTDTETTPETQVTEAEANIQTEAEQVEAAETVETVGSVASLGSETIAPDSETNTETTPEPETTPETSPAEPKPFWANSDRDRQSRIEAIAAPESVTEPDQPETAPTQASTPAQPPRSPAPVTTTPPSAPQVPTNPVEFDEGFLWSAEVLAAQGRRPEDISAEEITWLKQLRQGLGKTRMTMVNRIKAAVGQGPLDQAAVDDLEALLLQADVGVQATDKIITALQDKLEAEDLPADEAIAYLKQLLRDMLDAPTKGKGRKFPANLEPERNQLNVWLITGVNGAGKTTTIGKIAHLAKRSGYKTIIAAADTFRAAAVEQVKVWGDRAGVEVIANPGKNTDPAAVVFDAITAAQARHSELLLVDTAGRLQNKKNLMEELSKIRRIVDKKASGAKVESLLVLDSSLGQNGLRQAEVFSKSAGVSGVVLTKLDGSAKGGVAIAVVQQLKLPIRFIGAGEGIEDLRPFSSYEFVEALLSN